MRRGRGGANPGGSPGEGGCIELPPVDPRVVRGTSITAGSSVMRQKPQVATFINPYLTHVNDEIIDVGYFPASVEAMNASRRAWLDAQQ